MERPPRKGRCISSRLNTFNVSDSPNQCKMQKPIIIAHRGASAYAEENTLESFKKALDAGADMIEFDIRRTKDNTFIAYHDRLLHDKPINELTHREIESSLQSRDIHVPTIEEILSFLKGKIRMDVEIKEEGYENELIELIGRYFDMDEFIVTSFNDSSVREIRSNFPWVRAGLILGKPKPKKYFRTRFSELFPMKRCKMAKADLLVPHFKLLRFGFLNRAGKNRKPVYVWTVNDERMMVRFLSDHRVEAIITDRPDLAVAMRNEILPIREG